MQSEKSLRYILRNPFIWECKMHTSFNFRQTFVTGDRWSQHLSWGLHTWPGEISTGRGRKIWKYLQPQFLHGEWCGQTLLVRETRCYEVSLPARASPRNVLGWVLRVVAPSRKSSLAEGYIVPDMCLLAPPDAMTCAPSDPQFPGEYFDTLSCRV